MSLYCSSLSFNFPSLDFCRLCLPVVVLFYLCPIFIALVFVKVYAYFSPYRDTKDNLLQELAQTQVSGVCMSLCVYLCLL
jgi:hypothetical protein